MVGIGRPYRPARHEADPLVDVAQGRLGDRARLLGPALEHVEQLGLVVEQLEGPLAERRHEVDHDLGQVLLQVAVPAAVVLLLEDGDRARASARSRS